MNAPIAHPSLSSYVRAVDGLIERTLEAAGLEPDQHALMRAGLLAKKSRKPIWSHSLAPLYLTIRAHGQPVGADTEPVGAGLMLFYFALDLFDSVQDDELTGPYGDAGSELAITSATTLFLLALDLLHGFVRTLPPGLQGRAAGMLREHALRSARGQHRDIVSRGQEISADDARTTSIEKSALSALRMEYAGIYVASKTRPVPGDIASQYREIGDATAELRQLVNDIADIFDGDRSEDLRQGTMSVPLALFVARTGDRGRQALAAAQRGSVDERELQRQIHDSGIMLHVAARTEAARRRVHAGFAALGCGGPYLAVLLAGLDELTSIYYRPRPLTLAVDIDAVDASPMSADDRVLLEALRDDRKRRGIAPSHGHGQPQAHHQERKVS